MQTKKVIDEILKEAITTIPYTNVRVAPKKTRNQTISFELEPDKNSITMLQKLFVSLGVTVDTHVSTVMTIQIPDTIKKPVFTQALRRQKINFIVSK